MCCVDRLRWHPNTVAKLEVQYVVDVGWNLIQRFYLAVCLSASAFVGFVLLFQAICSRKTAFSSVRRRSADISGELSQVLGGGGEQHFVANAGQSPEPEPVQIKDALHMGEGHLYFFAVVA